MSIKIAVKSFIEWLGDEESENRMERVLWIDESGQEAFVIQILNEKALPERRTIAEIEEAIAEERAIKRVIDPISVNMLPDSEIKDEFRKKRDRAWEIIKDLVANEPEIYNSRGRGTAVRATAKQYGVHPITVYKFLHRYWVGGLNALIPRFDRCGCYGKDHAASGAKRGRRSRLAKRDSDAAGVNITEEMKAIFRLGIKLFYNKRTRIYLTRTWQLTKEKFFNKGYKQDGEARIPILPPTWELPTYPQFYYHYRKEQNLRKTITARAGELGFATKHRSVLGSSTQQAIGPGSIYQIDATIADVYLVSSYNREWIIGRPILYYVVDVLTRMIVGLYICLDGPNWVGAMMALANTMMDKVAFCAEYGITLAEEDWPCRALPENILGDNSEMKSYNSDQVIASLDISILNTAPYRADLKGIVEQTFRLANIKTIEWIPGAVRKREPGEKDYRLDATLTLYEFTQLMIYTVLEHNEHPMDWYERDPFMIQDNVQPIPREIWRWGMVHRFGHLREESAKKVILGLMPKDEATVTYRGIRFKGMFYGCDYAMHNQWFEKARRDGNWTISVAYDPRNVNSIYYYDRNGDIFDVCNLLEREGRYKDRRLEEVLDLLEIEAINSDLLAPRDLQNTAEYSAKRQVVLDKANKQSAATPKQLSNAARTKAIRSNKALEIEATNEERAFTPDKLTGQKLPAMPQEPVAEPISSKKNKVLEMLKNQREGAGQ
jgi:hypothetical protein